MYLYREVVATMVTRYYVLNVLIKNPMVELNRNKFDVIQIATFSALLFGRNNKTKIDKSDTFKFVMSPANDTSR